MNLTDEEEVNFKNAINCHLCLKELNDCEVIIPYKNENDTRQNFYQINPFHSWRGNAKERVKAINHLKGKQQLKLDF